MIPSLEDVARSYADYAKLTGIAISFIVYAAATSIHTRIGAPVFLHPLLIAIVVISGGLWIAGVPYEVYFASAEPLHLLLGPVVVLLAVPLARQAATIRRLGISLLPILLIGATTGILTSAGIAMWADLSPDLVASLTPKSVTTPVAITLSESLGGTPPITTVVVILTGLVGATFGWHAVGALGIDDPRARGFAIGLGSHVIGTARMLQINEVAGAFSSLGMILNAVMTAGLVIVLQILLLD